MANQLFIAVTFIGFLALITFVGIYSASRKQNTTADYLLASRGVNPWLTALSAMSTGQSGLLFLGQVGFSYKIGISSIWLVIGWAIGDYLAWWFFFKRLREVSEETSSDTVSALLAYNTSGRRWISIVSGVIIIAFLGSYAASQLVAGSKTLNVVFGWDYYLGSVLGAIIVVIYCFSGGVRAEIWTDAAQGIIMIGSLLLLLIVAVINCGGLGELWTKLAAIDPQLVSFSPTNLPLGFVPFFVGWIVAGFGVVGQPHILTRAMAIDSPNSINRALNIKTICGLVNSFSALAIGLAARVLLPELMTGGDPELALLYLAEKLLPSIFVGLMLAGVFAAILSTADSQILCCSAALTQDIFPNFANSYKLVKLGTLTVAIIVLNIALAGDKNVFLLVIFSWSALASGLGPLLMLRTWKFPVNASVAILMMSVGIVAAISWSLVFKLSSVVSEVLPGIAAGFLVYLVARIFRQTAQKHREEG
ncbi:sodium/proline symporter [Brasilonema sp. UFV-L1]|uniref:sodium/proline symporter n=1 Tax=Brasilonema sp. UFV-L1 TaxID=2234130 RepID=UPI00145EB447|nr:sodium/proline symporter [Brasilonema sp. UFV-L1]NMG05515.1 sodium/proline symporter [Brasilonema sp. UFV-L1]